MISDFTPCPFCFCSQRNALFAVPITVLPELATAVAAVPRATPTGVRHCPQHASAARKAALPLCCCQPQARRWSHTCHTLPPALLRKFVHTARQLLFSTFLKQSFQGSSCWVSTHSSSRAAKAPLLLPALGKGHGPVNSTRIRITPTRQGEKH